MLREPCRAKLARPVGHRRTERLSSIHRRRTRQSRQGCRGGLIFGEASTPRGPPKRPTTRRGPAVRSGEHGRGHFVVRRTHLGRVGPNLDSPQPGREVLLAPRNCAAIRSALPVPPPLHPAFDCPELMSHWTNATPPTAAAPLPRLPCRPRRRSAQPEHWQRAHSRLGRQG